MRSHNKSTSSEISKLLQRVGELEERNAGLEWSARQQAKQLDRARSAAG